MTTPPPPSNPASPVRPKCVPRCVPEPSPGRRESSASQLSPISDGDALHEPAAQCVPSTSPGASQTHFNPGTTWLITDRTRPAWTATLDLLDDDQWHSRSDVAQIMRGAADLADRTIATHIRSACRRGWITKRGDRIRLRHRHLIEAALDHMAGRP